ncbi:Cysteine desulfurase mitochondrial [Salvia divinorum]|uniref:Cysteine desulfurase mitochondrial n=1 Tax=Salvia divinorum TaxID=28513 RepID=A0ABD1GLE0_SALDI
MDLYAKVQNQMAFVNNGQVVVNTSLPLGTDNFSSILSIKPIAVASSGLLCELEGNYLETDSESMEHVDSLEHVQCLKFSCLIPAVTGRGFIEVEDQGLGSSYYPFVIAEENVCAEIRMLEKEIELIEEDHLQRGMGRIAARGQVMEFIHEMGWLLHKYQLKSQYGNEDSNLEFFPF